MHRLLLLEINEIPFRLLDKYIHDPEFSNIRQFFESSWQFEGRAVDGDRLHPWVTWPTVHRGMSAKGHHIFHLGQDVHSFRGTAIWEELRKKNKTIGIMGPLQSWPPKNPGRDGFYIPDTFAHDERCIPAFVEPLQSLNLGLVKKNGRIVSKELPPLRDIWGFVRSLWRCGVSLRTIGQLCRQLVGEKFNPTIRSRRPIFQTILFWDVFKSLYFKRVRQIDYSSFFTNHVAGVMHRYWSHVFPEDFKSPNSGGHEPTMRFALKVLNDMLGDVLALLKKQPDLIVVFCTSMGQGPVHYDDHHGFELTIGSVEKLLLTLGFAREEFEPRLAMVPCIGVEFKNEIALKRAMEMLGKLTYTSGRKAFHVSAAGLSLHVDTVRPPLTDIQSGVVRHEARSIPFEEIGIRVIETEAGTGYHIPEGILAIRHSSLKPQPAHLFRQSIDCDRIKDLLLRMMEEGPQVIYPRPPERDLSVSP